MRRALVIDPGFTDPGGGACVAAHVLEALRQRFEVTLVSWDPIDFTRVNSAFGTALDTAHFRLRRVPGIWRRAIAACPFPLALLRLALLTRRARKLLRRERFDLVVSTTNEMDVGVPAIQYVHFPWSHFPRPHVDYRWYHLGPLLTLYRRAATAIGGSTTDGIRRNLTLVNSSWTKQRFEQWYRAPARVLFPPVPIDRAPLPWADRADTFVCLGRVSPEKNIHGVIGILAEVRRRGHAVSLLIMGQRQSPAYESKILATASAHRDWISLALDVSRAELVERVARCRFGIHGMVGEHFGIAVAEMARLGCVCFAPEDGGPAEILADPALLYASPGDAADKICRLLADPEALARTRERLQARAAAFTAARFTAEFLQVCSEFLGETRDRAGSAAPAAPP